MVQDPKWVKVGHRYAVGYVRPSFGRTTFKLCLSLSGLGFRLKHSSRYKMLQLMVKTHGAGLPLPAWLDSLVCYSMSLWVSLIYESTVQCVGSPAFMINLGNLDLPLHRASISSFRSQQLKLLNCGTFTQDLKKKNVMLCSNSGHVRIVRNAGKSGIWHISRVSFC